MSKPAEMEMVETNQVGVDLEAPKATTTNISDLPSIDLFTNSGRQKIMDALATDGTFVKPQRMVQVQNDGLNNTDVTDVDIESGLKPKMTADKLGTMSGVFLPCMQNILGVILFLRLPFIVAQAGCIQTTLIILFCVMSTALTSLSLSAIATNGTIQAGGPYYVISRNLGVEIGGALGFLFYLGTTIACSMYILGATEAVQTGFDLKDLFFFDTQIIALVIMFMVAGCVSVGIKYVNMSAMVFLAIVFFSIFCLCLGVVLFRVGSFDGQLDDSARISNDNMGSNYGPDPDTGITPNFFSLLALFYPSVTGIMAGSNRSAVLASPGQSIPSGTIGAISCTTFIYMFIVWLFGTSLSNEALYNDKMIVTAVAYPHEIIVKLGIIMSCVGAGLQCMAGAPRLLAAIADDDSIPFLRPFAPPDKESQPIKAIWLTWFIASLPCLAGNLDFITPIITLFFLLMYSGVNFSCFILSILKSPGFRPSFRYYHWAISLFGTFWCVGLGLVISWATTLAAIFLFVLLYIYIKTQGATKEWGDAVRGLRYGIARDELLALAVKDNFHAKNWRPQLLTIVDVDENGNPKKPQMLSLAGQLKKGRGLNMIAAIISGDVLDNETCERAKDVRQILKLHMKNENIDGFLEVIPSAGSISEAIWGAAIHSGLGPLSPNAVMLDWPEDWAENNLAEGLVSTLKGLTNLNKAILMLKGGSELPVSIERMKDEVIDIWWVVHDGGLLLLLPYLLSMHKTWKSGTKLRLFAVVTSEKENPLTVARAIEAHLVAVRIVAEVKTVDLSDTSIAGDMRQVYTKTVDMKKRREFLRALENPATMSQNARHSNAAHASPTGDVTTGHATIAEVFAGVISPQKLNPMKVKERTPSIAEGVKDEDVTAKSKEMDIDEKRMRTAMAFNRVLTNHSEKSKLIVTNLPLMRSVEDASDFCGYVDVMTEGLGSILMIRGAGEEVVTTYG